MLYFAEIPASNGFGRANEIINVHMKAGSEWGVATGVALSSLLFVVALMAALVRN